MISSTLFQWVLAGPDERQAVKALHDAFLVRLTEWLLQDYDADGATGRVLGHCMLEQVERFTKEVKAKEGKR